MQDNTQFIVTRIGQTDQDYIAKNTPALALERADLRLQLVLISRNRSERLHFLHEAIVILERSRVEFEEMPMSLYLDLSIELSKAYMLYFELTKDLKFATVSQQILKPLAHLEHGDIWFYLAYASAVKDEYALTRHWLNKYVSSNQFDHELMQSHSAFTNLKSHDWFKALIRSRTH